MAFINEGGSETSPINSGAFEPCKMFVGGLSWDTTPVSMKAYFQQYGEVTDCVVMKDAATDKPRGFGFVTFADPTSVDLALNAASHTLDDKKIDPKRANAKGSVDKSPPQSAPCKKVFVGGLSFDTDEDGIKKAFAKEGYQVKSVDIKTDTTGRKRGFAFVDLESEDDVEKACMKHFIMIDTKKVEVKKAEPKTSSREKKDGVNVMYNTVLQQQQNMAAAALNYNYGGSDRYNNVTQYGSGGTPYSYPQYSSGYPDYSSSYNQPGSSPAAAIYPNYTGGYSSGFRGQQPMGSYGQDSSSYSQSRNGFPGSGGGSGYGYEQGAYTTYGEQQHSGSNSFRSSLGSGGQSRGNSSSNYQSYITH